MDEVLRTAREMLETLTPLKRDCGHLCGARCCATLEGEETGMLLFPGEEEAYRDRPGWVLRETGRGFLLICPGHCRREERPLACRLFPLLPLPGENGVRVKIDLRALPVCPLTRQGRKGMDPAFVEVVRQAGTQLMSDARQRLFLEGLEKEQRELSQLRRELGALNE